MLLTALNIVMMSLGAEFIKIRKTIQTKGFQLFWCYQSILIGVGKVQYGIDNLICLLLMFDIVLG